jgi:hypothetical protein
MKANILRIVAATAFFGLLFVPRAHADTRFSIQFGAPVVVAPAPVYVDGYYWQPGYYASVGYGRRWVSGYWVNRHYRDRWERDRWERQRWEQDRREHERFDRDRRFDDRDRGWRR